MDDLYKSLIEKISSVQKVIIEISKSFVDLNQYNFDAIINKSLEKLGMVLNADRAYIFEYNFSENTMDNSYEWCNEGVKPEIDSLQGIPVTYYLEGWVNTHRKKQNVFIKDLEELDKNSNLYKVLLPQGINTLLTLPMFIEKECVGYIGFDALHEKQDWSGILDTLSILPEMFSSLFAQNETLIELRGAQHQAQVASNTQSDFIAKVTHELRTPINGVQNALYLMQKTNLTSDQTQYTEIMEYSLEVLSGMVNNILDYSKIEKQKLIFKSSDINLENELIKLIQVNKYMANSKGLGLYLNYDYTIPTILSADSEKIRQILNNLIVNAIKYTNYGHVEIKVSKIHNESPYIDLLFEIIDTGIGITKQNQAQIFNEFYQVGDSLNKTPQGTGLGLTITKEFLHFLKSDLNVESELRKGSNFSFTLKLYSPSEEERQILDKSALIIDLSEGEHSNVTNFLEAHYAQVDTCNTKTLRQSVRENYDHLFVYTNEYSTFSVKMDKIESVLEKIGPRMKKVLLYDEVKKQDFVDKFGLFDCTIEFPCSSEMLIDRITTCGNDKAVAEISELEPEVRKQKILLVDDNNINRRVMGELLKGMYIDVTEAKDGFEALEIAKKQTFNMIFMDIMMPGMDGYETSKKIRELEGVNGSIPIIAVTANDTETTKEKIVEYGMNGVLPKPLRKDNLEELLNEYFSNIIHATEQTNESLPVFDKNEFELFYEEDFLRREILETFINDKSSDLERISDAFAVKDCKKIHKALHYMKGSFTYLKAKKILSLGQQILDLSEDNNLSEVLILEEPLLQNYDVLLKELLQYLDTLK